MVDLCKSIKGVKEGDNCAVGPEHQIFKHCQAIGGTVQGNKCIISEERLKQLIEK
jgi:hypothetical protein